MRNACRTVQNTGVAGYTRSATLCGVAAVLIVTLGAALTGVAGAQALPTTTAPAVLPPADASLHPSRAPLTPTPAGPPVLQAPTNDLGFEPKDCDFGEVWSGAAVLSTVKVTNTSGRTISNIRAHPSCGCTTSSLSHDTLAPGESATMSVGYDTLKPREQVNETISLFASAQAAPVAIFALRGHVKPLFELKPSSVISFPVLACDSVQTQVLKLRNLYTEPLPLTLGALPDNPAFKAELREIESGQAYELAVTTVPPLKEGFNSAGIVLKTGRADLAAPRITVTANVLPPVAVFPPRIIIPRDATAETLREVQVRIAPGTSTHVVRLHSECPLVHAQLASPPDGRPTPTGANILVQVNVPPAAQLPPEGATLIIGTDSKDARFQTMEVPIQLAPAGAPARPRAAQLAMASQPAQPPSPPSAPTTRPTEPPIRAQPPPGTAPGLIGAFRFDPPQWDFGEVWYGTPTRTTVRLINAGDKPLEGISVRSSCHCTVPTLERTSLAPGESMPMTVIYDTQKNVEEVHQTISVYAGDPNRPTTVSVFHLKGRVKQILKFEPPTDVIAFSQLGPDTVDTRRVLIRNVYRDNVHLQLAPFGAKEFKVELREVEPGAVYELTVTTVPPLRPGISAALIQLLTDMPQVPAVQMRATAVVTSTIGVDPAAISVDRALQAPTPQSLRLRFRTDQPVKLLNVTSSSPLVTWKLTSPAGGRILGNLGFHMLTVTVPAGKDFPAGGFTLTLETDAKQPEFQKLVVPITLKRPPATSQPAGH